MLLRRSWAAKRVHASLLGRSRRAGLTLEKTSRRWIPRFRRTRGAKLRKESSPDSGKASESAAAIQARERSIAKDQREEIRSERSRGSRSWKRRAAEIRARAWDYSLMLRNRWFPRHPRREQDCRVRGSLIGSLPFNVEPASRLWKPQTEHRRGSIVSRDLGALSDRRGETLLAEISLVAQRDPFTESWHTKPTKRLPIMKLKGGTRATRRN